MNIVRKDNATLLFKAKNATVTANSTILVGDVALDGPGEYDVAGVAVRGIKTAKQTVWVMILEDVRVCVMPTVSEALNSDQLDLIGGVDIAVVPIGGESTVAEALSVVNALESRMAVIIGDGDTASVPQGANTLTLAEPYKVTKATLPQEERIILINRD